MQRLAPGPGSRSVLNPSLSSKRLKDPVQLYVVSTAPDARCGIMPCKAFSVHSSGCTAGENKS